MYIIENLGNFLKCYHFNKDQNFFVKFKHKTIFYTLTTIKHNPIEAFKSV